MIVQSFTLFYQRYWWWSLQRNQLCRLPGCVSSGPCDRRNRSDRRDWRRCRGKSSRIPQGKQHGEFRWRCLVGVNHQYLRRTVISFACVLTRTGSEDSSWHFVCLQELVVSVLTSSRQMTRKHANYFYATDRRASIHAFRFVCVFAGRLVNMPRVACHHGGWRVYTPSFLGVRGVMVGWPRTKGTASNEQVYSFCGFLPNPFIQDLCLWCTSQEFVKTDLYPLSRDLSQECRLFDWALVDNRPLRRSLPMV